MTARFVALVAGVLFFFLAVFTQGILTLLEPSARTTDVTAVVRTDLGQLKWMATEATDYTPLQQRGRRVYLSEGCWYCHSQYVRPVTGETRRWGPVSEAGEYAFDVPHLFGTRRIGPDLTRVGLKYGDEWHYAHFWNPACSMRRTSGLRSSMMERAIGPWRKRRSPRRCLISAARSRSS
jgi:cytochrome c oxidase cbb3-type subunit 2